ncbi:hypothetical protein U14_01896 [Candidatus Moduliflexus flocculans]|uniref:Uncharacterized protein n=1 Tax=Candidatus Moduliflexus flocculans TaxID=1499966 RepID=A0A0S6VTC6_9BACT|nr:hypothetical protein U14_01896 [Candidatus Moduliflexus flocculans]
MKYILISQSFRRQLKVLRRYLTEQDVVDDIARFIRRGLTKGETFLEAYTISQIHLEIVKLRLSVYRVDFRYLIGVIEQRDYLPIIIDLKKGRYGQNLSLNADRQTVVAIESAIIRMVEDYLEHTEASPTLTAYSVEES